MSASTCKNGGIIFFVASSGHTLEMKRTTKSTREELNSPARMEDGNESNRLAWTDRLYSLFMQAPAMIAVLRGPTHIFEIANPGYMKLVGATRDIIGKPVREALSDVEGQGFFELLDQVYTSGKVYQGYEQPLRIDRDGETSELYLNFIYQPIVSEKGVTDGIFVHVVDVTEQVQNRLRIEESETKYQTLFNSVDQGFCILEMLFDEQENPIDYRFLETNRVFEQQTGLINAIGKTARELVPNLEDHWTRIYGQVALTGESVKFIEGSEAMGRWFEVFAFAVGRKPSKVALLFTDITKRKQDDDLRRRVMAELEDRVDERTKDLNAVNLALQKSNEDLLQFAHVASHDLKEPVRKIQTFADLLRRDTSSSLSERGTGFLNKIQHASQRMVSMIDGVLRYSSLDSYGQSTEKMYLTEILQAIETDFEVLIQDKKAILTYDKEFPVFEGAPLLIFQLFFNLINNALKFSRPGVQPVVSVTGTMEQSHGSEYVVINVKDNGVGFDPAYAHRIFITFARLHSKDVYEGTGLGLSLCKKIVDRHGGTITADAAVDQGATFTVRLPVVQERTLL